MKIGLCCPAVDADVVKQKGGEYTEVNATEILQMNEKEFAAFLSRVQAGKVVPLCANCLVPGDLPLTGPDVDFDKVRAHAEAVFARLAKIGVKTAVFGSGKAKQVPDGFPMERAWEQLYRVAEIFADEAEKYGQTVVIEGLRRCEVNIVNTIEDVAYYVHRVDRPNVKMLADFFHIAQNGEDFSVIKKYAKEFAHFHIATPDTREMPKAKDADFVKKCMDALREIGYEGTLSYEGAHDDKYTGAEETLALIRSFL